MTSAISPRGELHFQVHESGIRPEEFLDFCKMLVADVGRPVFLIIDNSQVRRAKILVAHAEQSEGMLTLSSCLPIYQTRTLMNGLEEREAR
jgi:hypothetical protein